MLIATFSNLCHAFNCCSHALILCLPYFATLYFTHIEHLTVKNEQGVEEEVMLLAGGGWGGAKNEQRKGNSNAGRRKEVVGSLIVERTDEEGLCMR